MIVNSLPEGASPASPATILAVDDSPEILKMLVEVLTMSGYQVRTAESGESALAGMAANQPDLILLDVCLPGMDGFEVCRLLKASEETRHIPIILISGFAEVQDWVKGLQLGAADYIGKPFHPAEILTRVKTLLALRQAHVSLEQQAAALRQTNEQLQAEIEKRQGMEDELRRSLDRSECSRRTLLSTLEDWKRSEAERELLRTAIEQTSEAIIITDPQGAIQYVNPAFEHITGYTKAEAIGKNPRIFKSGRQDKAFYRNLWETITGGQIFHGRMVNKRKDGTLFTEETTISPVRDAAGAIINYVAVKRDITDRLRLETRFQQAQKMEAIGTLAGGIAHDFNNILTAILGYAEFAMKEVGEQSKAAEDLQQVITAGERAVDLVRQILTISRQSEEQEWQPVKIQFVIKEALKFLRPTMSASIRIKSTINMECPAILADPTEIHQVVMNLCTNAYHAMRDIKRNDHVMELRLVAVELDEAAVVKLGLNSPGLFVRMSVSDTGCGIEAETLSRIFEPYFTTKMKGQGTGLGLATVHSIVTHVGGSVIVESEIGQGATFTVFFPAHEEYPLKKETVVKEEITERGSERIMVVDDEEAIAQLLQRALAESGYQVSAFTNSEEAMRIFMEQPTAFNFVISDMNMPKIMGTDLAEAFLAIRPDIPIILCTGFSEKVDTEKAKNIGIRELLYKPVNHDVLARLVRKILDENEVYNVR